MQYMFTSFVSHSSGSTYKFYLYICIYIYMYMPAFWECMVFLLGEGVIPDHEVQRIRSAEADREAFASTALKPIVTYLILSMSLST